MSFSRRKFVSALGACAAFASLGLSKDASAKVNPAGDGPTLPVWREGTLEIHHIATGRGNSTFVIGPDGTTMLIDAGAIYDPLLYTIEPRPNNSRRPGEWVARYIQRRTHSQVSPLIDYAMVTHFHGDHIGQALPYLPMSRKGGYQLTGITDVADLIEIGVLIDRGFPNYDYPTPLTDQTTQNYRKFVRHRLDLGQKVATLDVGSSEQIVLKHRRASFPEFRVHNLAANGVVTSGAGVPPTPMFPKLETLSGNDLPNENMCSLAWLISFGPFSYYTGGDLTNDTNFGRAPWRDIESTVAKAAGPVTVAVANHHGYVNGMGPDAVTALRPKAFIVFAWDSAHPTISPLFNMLSGDLYSGERQVYATAVKAENVIATRDISKMTSSNGHIVVRVSDRGRDFEIFVVDNRDERDIVTKHQGPFRTS